MPVANSSGTLGPPEGSDRTNGMKGQRCPLSPSVIPNMGGEALKELDPDSKFMIEDTTALLNSSMWNIATNYYNEAELDAFTSNDVPMFVTSNAQYARTHAELAWAFIKDELMRNQASGDAFRPVVLLEIGGGHGRFSYLFLRHLGKYEPIWEAMGCTGAPFLYVFTDIAAGNVESMRTHSHFEEFVQKGWMDFAVLDCNTELGQDDVALSQMSNGWTHIPEGHTAVVIANYVYDSLKTDYIQVSPTGRVSRAYCALYSPLESDLKDPTSGRLVSRMSFKWEWRTINDTALDLTIPTDEVMLRRLKEVESHLHVGHLSPDLSVMRPVFEGVKRNLKQPEGDRAIISSILSHSECDLARCEPTSALSYKDILDEEQAEAETPYYLDDPALRLIIETYRNYAKKENKWLTATIPLGALHFMSALTKKRRCLFLVGDKGYSGIQDLHGKRDPHIAVHGSLSFMVNMKSLKDFIFFTGGSAIATPFTHNFQICALITPYCDDESTIKAMPNLVAAACERLSSPPDSTLLFIDLVRRGHSSMKASKKLFGLLRAGGYDQDFLEELVRHLITDSGTVALGDQPKVEVDLIRDLNLIYEKWYSLSASDGSIPQSLAFIAMRLGRTKHAIHFLAGVPEVLRDASYWSNLASCCNSLSMHDQAIEACGRALTLLPEFPAALKLKANAEYQLRPVRLAVIGGLTRIDPSLLSQILVDGRLRIRVIACEFHEDAEAILANIPTLKIPPVIYTGDNFMDQLLEDGGIDAVLVEDIPDPEQVIMRLFAAGVHVLSGVPLSPSGADEVVTCFMNHRHSRLLSSSFLLWHSLPGPLCAELKSHIQTVIEKPEYILGLGIEILIQSETEEPREHMSIQMRRAIVDLFDLMEPFGVSLREIHLVPQKYTTMGWLVISFEGGAHAHVGITAAISATASRSVIKLQTPSDNISVTMGDNYTVETNQAVTEIFPGPMKNGVDLFMDHHIQECRSVRPRTDDQARSESRRLTLGLHHMLKYRALMARIDGFFVTEI